MRTLAIMLVASAMYSSTAFAVPTAGLVSHVRVNMPGSNTYVYYRGAVNIAGCQVQGDRKVRWPLRGGSTLGAA